MTRMEVLRENRPGARLETHSETHARPFLTRPGGLKASEETVVTAILIVYRLVAVLISEMNRY